MSRTWTAVALLGLLALAAVASAETEKPAPAEKKGLAATERAKREEKARETHEGSFVKADTDKDGALSKDEYKAFFRASLEKVKTVSKQAVESSDKIRGDIFDRLDSDKDGKLTKEEWHGQHQARNRDARDTEEGRMRPRSPFRGTPEEKAAEFAAADTDKSKTLSADEFATYMAELSPRHSRGGKDARVRSAEQEARMKEHEDRRRDKQAGRNKEVFKRFDLDNDGQLSEEEFLNPTATTRGRREGRSIADKSAESRKKMEDAQARRGAKGEPRAVPGRKKSIAGMERTEGIHLDHMDEVMHEEHVDAEHKEMPAH